MNEKTSCKALCEPQYEMMKSGGNLVCEAMVALVGRSLSGKTSLIDTIMNFDSQMNS